MKHRSFVALALALVTVAVVDPRVQAALSVPLTIQEAIYPGVAGVARTAEPVTVGIPLPDDAANGVTDASQLTLTGATAGQFRVLGRWPSGRIKWVLVDTLASLSAGGKATGIALATGGSGNFGGSNLATDNGATISVSTGTATFTIRKANFNGFEQVVVGGTTVVAAGASAGLVISGPSPGNTTCGNCSTLYSSANDASSTAVIEENGPVKTVIRATGSHKDGSGNAYMKFTVRMYFYRNLSRVKAVTSLRNADHGASNSFATATKGHQGYEWWISPTLSGTPTYDIAKHDGAVESGTLPGATDDVYLYQGASDSLKHEHWGCCGTVPYTTDAGYVLVKNGSTLATGTRTQYPQGWADIRGASNGAGLSIGLYQFAAYWPKSLEFNDGGRDVRIGIWPRQNSRPYYQVWPQWSTHDLYFNFHSSALPSPANEFVKFQHGLLGRAALAHYNTTGVFPYPIVDPAVEDAFYATTHSTAKPANNFPFVPPQDASPSGGQLVGNGLRIYRVKDWRQGGESNQQEYRWSWLFNFIQRGFAGRYVNATHFYRFQTDDTLPHSDGFNWRDFPAQTDQFGRPEQGYTNSLNVTLAHRSWFDQEHGHWYGMTDYYFMSGDELVKEALLDGYADWHLDDTAYQAGDFGGLFDSRADGVNILSAARYATFLKAIGNTAEAATVLNNAADLFAADVKGVLCTNAEQASQGCTTGPAHGGPWPDEGTSRTRGMVWSGGGLGSWCGVSSPGLRFHSTWSSGAFVQQGLLELADAKGPSWSDYWLAQDLAYGMAQGNDDELWRSLGNGRWDQDGWRFGNAFDIPANCASPPPTVDQDYWNNPAQLSHWMTHYTRYRIEGSTNWVEKVRIAMLKAVNYTGVNTADYYGYQLGAVIAAFSTPTAPTLTTVPITNVVPNGGGSYTVSWVVPAGAKSYRIKWGSKRIVDWIGFNAATNTFVGNPTTTMAWFAAANVPTLPTPGAPGSTQSLTIATGTTGLDATNFSVKAYVGGTGGTTPPPSPATTLALVSGNNQTGTVSTPLSAPFTVKAADAGGNPVAGINVTFGVTAGGGSVSNTLVATNASGLASTTLTLGSAAGTNTVSATSGTLAGSPITFTAVASGSDVMPITPNRWVNVTPTYQGAPNGGNLMPMTCNNMGVYDPVSKRTISYDRWYDSIRNVSIYANALVAYEPASNVATVLKLTNWLGTDPLPANATDPTPIDRHPLGGVGLDPLARTVYLVNGANQAGRPTYYPDHPNDTWRFSLTGGSWSKVADPIANPSIAHPPSDVGTYSGMVHDPPTGKLAYFETKYNGTGTKTWLFDPAVNRWSALNEDPSSANVHISTAGIAYDTRRNLVVAYGGGYNSAGPPSAQLWAYSVSQNKWTALPNAPIPATAPEFAYDSVHDVFLALVGQSTLIFNPRTNAWSYLAATIDRGQNLNRQNVTYNPAQDVFVFQGGSWDKPVWSLFRYSDASSPALKIPTAPSNLRIVR